jgi:hypothetical protein
MCNGCWPFYARIEYVRTCTEYSQDVYDAFGTPDDKWSKEQLKNLPMKIVLVANAINNVYAESVSGGNMHVIIDDWNIGDEMFEGDLREFDSNYPLTDNELACYAFLKALSEFDRVRALMLADGYV